MLTRLFEEDPDLLDDVPEADAARLARKVAVDVAPLPRGPWRPPSGLSEERLLGLLVLDGLLLREQEVMGRSGVELLGRGDVLRPGQRGGWESLPRRASWTVLEPARVAVLDRRFQLAIASWPKITVELMRRAMAQSHEAVVRLALARRQPLPPQVRGLLWQLADRFGRRRDGKVEIPLRISHRLLAELAGAERAAVTRAVQELRNGGAVHQRRGGPWFLLEDPPADLE